MISNIEDQYVEEEGEDSDGQEFLTSLSSPRRKKSASRLKLASRRKKADSKANAKLHYEQLLSTTTDSSSELPAYGYITAHDNGVHTEESWIGGDYEVEELQEERLDQRY